jgi:uncharacterized protein (TIGR03435 family)
MIRNLLVGRFKLRFEFESTEMPVYLLTMRRPEVLGPQLSVSDVDCTLADTPIALTRDRVKDSQPLHLICLYLYF